MTDRPFDVRGEIMSAIAKTNDEERRAMLMLMLGVLERVEKLLADEKTLRERVLNGVHEQHSDDHEWVATQRKKNCQEICDWVQDKMNAEAEALKAKKGFWNAARTGFAAKLAELAVTAAAATAAALWALK